MYTTKNNSAKEYIPNNCPCLEVENAQGERLKPICFIKVLKATACNITKSAQQIKHDEIMFCKSNVTIFDDSYPARIRRELNVSGYEHVKTPDQMVRLMNQLYWFKTYNTKHHTLVKLIKSLYTTRDWFRVQTMLKQVLYTINGLLIKKFLAFAPEISCYADIAKQTAVLFIELLINYDKETLFINGEPHEYSDGIYKELKEFFGFVKENFLKEKFEFRLAIVNYKFKNNALSKFFRDELIILKGFVRQQWSLCNDYTETLAWFFRMTILAQTRVMGYLPRHISEAKAYYYRRVISRQPKEIEAWKLQLIYRAIHQELREAELPPGILIKENRDKDQLINEMFLEVISRIELVIKPSASVTNTVANGGKLEDARLLVRNAVENKWEIPIRDLNNHKIKDYVKAGGIEEGDPNYIRVVFWASYQLLINRMIKLGLWETTEYCALKGSQYFEDHYFDAKILHIQEPGKDRNLTKSSAMMAWVLTPAGKVCQSYLSQLPEHEVGLTGSGHGWKYSRRLSSLSKESGAFYDKGTGFIEESFVQYYSDWTESTDFIEKEIGYTMLKAIMDYAGFPAKYGQLVLKTIVQPQPVVEVVRYQESLKLDTKIEWTGFIRNGFMMGNPVTKTILHASHMPEFQIAKRVLEIHGKHNVMPPKQSLPGTIRLDRDKLSKSMPQSMT